MTEVELLAAAPNVTARQLRRWREWRVLDPPRRTFPGRGGSISWYPPGSVEVVNCIATATGRGTGPGCHLAALALIVTGQPVPDEGLRQTCIWVAEGVTAAMAALRTGDDDPFGDPSWGQANAAAQLLIAKRSAPAQQVRGRLRAHQRELEVGIDRPSNADAAETVLTALLASAFGGASILEPPDLEAVAIGLGALAPGEQLGGREAAVVEGAIAGRPFEGLLSLARSVDLATLRERAELLRSVSDQLRDVTDGPPGVASMSDGWLRSPAAFLLAALVASASG